MPKRKSLTNATTWDILKFLFLARVPARRQNVLPVPVVRAGKVISFRPGSKVGVPDIVGTIPAGLLADQGRVYSVPFYCEIKTGRDRLRDEQVGFITTERSVGSIVFVVKDYQDFLTQWNELPWKKNK